MIFFFWSFLKKKRTLEIKVLKKSKYNQIISFLSSFQQIKEQTWPNSKKLEKGTQ